MKRPLFDSLVFTPNNNSHQSITQTYLDIFLSIFTSHYLQTLWMYYAWKFYDWQLTRWWKNSKSTITILKSKTLCLLMGMGLRTTRKFQILHWIGLNPDFSIHLWVWKKRGPHSELCKYTIRRILLFAKIKHWHPKAEHKENQDNQIYFSLLNISISIFLILAIALNN